MFSGLFCIFGKMKFCMTKLSSLIIIAVFLTFIVRGQVDELSSGDTIEEISFNIFPSIPCPINKKILINDLGISYQSNFIYPPKKIEDYNSVVAQALNLGICISNLEYLKILNQKLEFEKFFNFLKEGAQVMEIESIIDLESMHMDSGIENIGLLSPQKLVNFTENMYKEGKFKEVILIPLGAWLQLLFMNSLLNQKQPNKYLSYHIAEQKIFLEQFLLLFSFYEDDPEINELKNDLEHLRTGYDQVKIPQDFINSNVKDENGILIIQEDLNSKILISTQDLNSILQTVTQIREKIIHSK